MSTAAGIALHIYPAREVNVAMIHLRTRRPSRPSHQAASHRQPQPHRKTGQEGSGEYEKDGVRLAVASDCPLHLPDCGLTCRECYVRSFPPSTRSSTSEDRPTPDPRSDHGEGEGHVSSGQCSSQTQASNPVAVLPPPWGRPLEVQRPQPDDEATSRRFRCAAAATAGAMACACTSDPLAGGDGQHGNASLPPQTAAAPRR